MAQRLSTAEFISRSTKKHNGKYLYECSVYVSGRTELIITCPVHGNFNQLATSHLQGYGCSKCSKYSVGLTLDDFISKSRSIHGLKFDYSKVVYVNNKTPVIVTCDIHGDFNQLPSSHLSGRGCVHCRVPHNKKSRDEFIVESKKVHGDTYCYDNTEYISTNEAVSIACPTHGQFTKLPSHHLTGGGCPKCSIVDRDNGKWTTSQFIDQAVVVHKSRYSYDLVEYNGTNSPVTLVCGKHGKFDQLAQIHLKGGGCPKCAYDNNRSSTSEFIRKAVDQHGELYDYSNVKYVSVIDYIDIICKHHGVFQQTPNSHLSGHGCKLCTQTGVYDYNRLSTDKKLGNSMGWVYVIRLSNVDETFFKIGISANIKSRVSYMSNKYTTTLIAVAQLTMLQSYIVEQNILKLHTKYKPTYAFGGYTECISLADNELANLVELLETVDVNHTFNLI